MGIGDLYEINYCIAITQHRIATLHLRLEMQSPPILTNEQMARKLARGMLSTLENLLDAMKAHRRGVIRRLATRCA